MDDEDRLFCVDTKMRDLTDWWWPVCKPLTFPEVSLPGYPWKQHTHAWIEDPHFMLYEGDIETLQHAIQCFVNLVHDD